MPTSHGTCSCTKPATWSGRTASFSSYSSPLLLHPIPPSFRLPWGEHTLDCIPYKYLWKVTYPIISNLISHFSFRTFSFDMLLTSAFNFNTISPTTACGLWTKKNKNQILSFVQFLTCQVLSASSIDILCDCCLSPTGLKYSFCPMKNRNSILTPKTIPELQNES